MQFASSLLSREMAAQKESIPLTNSCAEVCGTVVRHITHCHQFDRASRHEKVTLVTIESLEGFREITIRLLLTFNLARFDTLELRGAARFIHFVDSVESISRTVTVINTSPTTTLTGDLEREGNALRIVISPRVAQIVCCFKDVRLS